jgi:hypothetical protein
MSEAFVTTNHYSDGPTNAHYYKEKRSYHIFIVVAAASFDGITSTE